MIDITELLSGPQIKSTEVSGLQSAFGGIKKQQMRWGAIATFRSGNEANMGGSKLTKARVDLGHRSSD